VKKVKKSKTKKQRRHVTLTVIVISSCFAITQGPSAVLSVWELLTDYFPAPVTGQWCIFECLNFF
jgi:hypothetical protein